MKIEIETKGTTITKYTSLMKVAIPDSVTTIGDFAFHRCPCWIDLRDRVAEIQNDKVTGAVCRVLSNTWLGNLRFHNEA